MKLPQIFAQIIELFITLWEWMCARPRNVVIATFTFFLVILGLVLFIEYVLPSLLVALIIIFVFFGETIKSACTPSAALPPPPTLEDNEVCQEITQFSYEVFLNARDILGEYAIIPKTVNDIYNPMMFRKAYRQVPMLTLHLLRKQKELSNENCTFIKQVLQSTCDARLRDGYLFGYLWAAPVAYDTPLLKIVSVESSNMYLHINILLTNTPMSVQAARLSDRHTPQPLGDHTDPLFHKSGGG